MSEEIRKVLIIEYVSPSGSPGIGGTNMTVQVAEIYCKPRIIKTASVPVTSMGADMVGELFKEIEAKPKEKVFVEIDADRAKELGLR